MMSQESSQVGSLSKYKICICQNQMIDKLWLGVGCSENSVLKIEAESHQSGAQVLVTIVVSRNTTILGT